MRKSIKIDREFPLSLGGSLPSLEITYEEWGDSSLPGERTLFVMPALSATSHMASHTDDPSPGWWEGMVGPGRGIDTNEFRVFCAAILGSPYGTTSPLSTDPKTGKPYGRDFPQITPADQAQAHAWLLDELGVEKIHGAVGSSLGGMQALQFAALYPDRLDRLIAVSSTGKTTPGTVALRRVGRLAILNDPDYQDGRYDSSRPPARGLAVARELGMIVYRSREEFNQRFGWDPKGPFTAAARTFEVESYLNHHGERFARVFDANCYLLLSRCMDLMDLGAGFRNYAEGVLRIDCSALIIGVDRDLLIPPSEQQHLAHLMESHGRDVQFEILPSIFGHDAFLKEYGWFNERLRAFLLDS